MASCADAPPRRRARPRRRRARSRPVARTRTPRTPPRPPTRRRARTTTRAAPARPRAARRPAAACAWSRSATSRPGLRHRAARRHAGGSSSSSRRARSSSCAAASRWPSRSWTSARRSRPAASRACSRWPSRPTTRSRGCSTSTTPRSSGTESIWEYHRASADRADAGSARLVLRMDDPEPNHNGGLMIFGPDKLHVRRHRRRRRRQRPARRARQRAVPRLAAGQDPAHRPAAVGRQAVQRSRRRTRSSGASGARGGDLRLRAAQPVALLLRPRQRRPRHRRRRAGRRSRRSTSSRRAAARGANFGWRPWEGRRRNFDEPAPGAVFPVITHTHQAGFCSITGGYVVRDRGVPGLYGRYVYGDFCNGAAARGDAARRRRAPSRDAVGAERLGRLVVRRGRRAGASTWSRSTARSTASRAR